MNKYENILQIFKFQIYNTKQKEGKKTKGCWCGARRRTPDSSSAHLLHCGMVLERDFVSPSPSTWSPAEDFQPL